MRGRTWLAAGVIGMLGPIASAGVVAHYSTDFTTSGPPKTGWQYQWNAASQIESSPNS